ncbi:sigma-54 interaction domain-containing protein [Calidifontibacillus erzurumensis]|uniref:HTH-type transcriptional regulatory protein TyrR n=1 Tax=Calidifontibacillus erzurumensis TaxID=2741433 RepID=A0A8J8KC22_9BACI|nr:sigma 54-interacting transcriptional regulator [Calidifontibacillus erzurumensis]NSL52177.1 sigma 54-interacting transcriptional regulator [Calidifontibacillus erzurumensis]
MHKTEHFFYVQENEVKFSSNLPMEQVEKIYAQYEEGVENYTSEDFYVHVIHSPTGKLFYARPIQQYNDTDILNPLSMKLLNSLSDGITISNKDGKIIFQNDLDIEIVGINCINRYAKDLVAEGEMSDSLTLKVLETKEDVTIFQTFLNNKCFLVTGKPIFDEVGELQYVLIITRDMSRLKNLEEEVKKLEIQNERFKQRIEELNNQEQKKMNIVAASPAMQKVLKRILRVAEVDSTVLIEGESGVGKEEVAKLIYLNSRRNTKQMLTINCSAIPESLLESELFGYVEGAFTGAKKGGKAGIFETANGGTIFLDEIGEMPLQLQAKLLRVLQESEVQRIGSTKPIPIDVRIIAATNRNLAEMVQQRSFREDLYYRLNIIPIEIPPLRERREDIVPLVYHFLRIFEQRYHIHRTLDKEALKVLEEYDWPGNVRQLKNIIERVSLLANQPKITASMIREELKGATKKKSNNIVGQPLSKSIESSNMDISQYTGSLKEQVAAFEKEVIKKALSQHKSIRQAAEALGCNQSTLVRKIQRYQLTKSVVYE